jgi:hypothetical protein
MTQNAQHRWRSLSVKRASSCRRCVKVKPKRKSATNPAKPLPSKPSELRGWPAIAQFLGMPNSTAHRWAKEGMPVRREGRNMVANPEELSRWLQRTSGEAAGGHVVTSTARPGRSNRTIWTRPDCRATLPVIDGLKNHDFQVSKEWKDAFFPNRHLRQV